MNKTPTQTTETRHYSDGTSAIGTPPLPALSPAQQDIKEALTEARAFALWPAGAENTRRVVALIDRALEHLP